ncbi:MAG: DUF1122 family protein [Aquificaceae bacterium]|nr:DUF1122 family protein [Aquificaceae bacterium]MDW8294577.1 DUF1122 family protein [Aquificaceae bacterium]
MEGFKEELREIFQISKVERGRFIEEENLTLEREGKRLMFLKAFYGRKPYWKEWVELFHIEPQFFRSPSEEELYRIIRRHFRRVFVEYYEDKQTLEELKRGIPPENTRLGSKFKLLGYRFFRDWYYPEGWMEGGYKLQAER